MEVIIFLILGLFVLAIAWAILKNTWSFILVIAVIWGISWVIQYGLSLLGLDMPLWAIGIFIFFTLGFIGLNKEKKVHKAVIEYFDTHQMGELNDIRTFLDKKSIECDDKLLNEIMVKLLTTNEIKEELPNKLWSSTKKEGFAFSVETVHIEI